MWTSTTIGGRAADVFAPADRPRFIVIYLADADGATLRDNPTWTSLLADHGLACVCPDGGASWWSGRICPSFDPARSAEQYLLDDVAPWVMANFAVPPSAIALAGVGAGGQGVLRLAFKHPERFRVVASLAGAIDHYELYGRHTCLDEMYPSREHCRQDGAILHVHPSHWPPYVWFACDPDSPWQRGNDRLHEKLRALGAPHQIDFSTQACGHLSDYCDCLAPAVLRFLRDAIEKESRRLL